MDTVLYHGLNWLKDHGEKLWYFFIGGVIVVCLWTSFEDTKKTRQRQLDLETLIKVDRQGADIRKTYFAIINDYSMPREFRDIVEKSLADYDAGTAYRICLIRRTDCNRFNEGN